MVGDMRVTGDLQHLHVGICSISRSPGRRRNTIKEISGKLKCRLLAYIDAQL